MDSITFAIVLGLTAARATLFSFVNVILGRVFLLLAALVALSLKMANAWKEFVVLRRANFRTQRPGSLFHFARRG
jgi:hypothetical protein